MQKYLKVTPQPHLSFPDGAREGDHFSRENLLEEAAGLSQAPWEASLGTSIRPCGSHGDQCPQLTSRRDTVQKQHFFRKQYPLIFVGHLTLNS